VAELGAFALVFPSSPIDDAYSPQRRHCWGEEAKPPVCAIHAVGGGFAVCAQDFFTKVQRKTYGAPS
jgi:hypothetical protein